MKSRRTHATNDRKAAQLCQQVRRALEYGVPEVLSDSNLDAMVMDVVPAPNTSHLMVMVQAAFSSDEETLAALQRKLSASAGVLRSMVAQSIHRRKAPTLSFRVVPS